MLIVINGRRYSVVCTEIEFFDINLTKESSLLLHVILLADFKENYTPVWF
jgi:hypothetical protein